MQIFHAVADFNDTIIETEIPEGQTQQAEDIQISDDEINEAPEAFYVLLDVLSEQRSNVIFRILQTLCWIRQSDCKLSHKYFMHLIKYTSQYRIITSCTYSCQFCVWAAAQL